MISHEFKCIFIHIPATAGSSIETALCGKDWAEINLLTKHMSSDIARIHYAQYWDKYFKFSIVRNPFDWLVSQYCYSQNITRFTFKDYVKYCAYFSSIHWNYPRDRIYLPLHRNINDIDFLGKFENLQADFNKICTKIGFNRALPKRKYYKRKRHKDYKIYYDEETREIAENLFAKDLEMFNYKF